MRDLNLVWPKKKSQWAVLLVGCAIVWLGALPLIQGLASLRWSLADGVITYSKPYHGWRIYRIDLHYQYTVAGRQYPGDRYRFLFLLDCRA